MVVVITVEERFVGTADGAVWTRGVFEYRFWTKYRVVFEEIRVIARVRVVEKVPEGYVRADGDGVSFVRVPHYIGPIQYLLSMSKVHRASTSAVGPRDAVIMRVPSQLGNGLYKKLRRERRPYGVEVLGDPWDVFAPGVVRHPLRPLLRRYFSSNLRTQCFNATAATYVTRTALQSRYPIRRSQGQLEVECSDVCIPQVTKSNPEITLRNGPLRLILVGSLDQLYKGPDIALRALQKIRQRGLDIRLTIAGEGRFRKQLELVASELGLEAHVEFLGQLAGPKAVASVLLESDIFIMPSRTEGLPRAMIEAMARGLPCIGSKIGGIPELLDPEDLVPVGDVEALAARITEVATSADRRSKMASRNLRRAEDFEPSKLAEQHRLFLTFLRHRTEEWIVKTEASCEF